MLKQLQMSRLFSLLLRWTPLAMVVLGTYLLARSGLAALVDLGWALRRLRRGSTWLSRLQGSDATDDGDDSSLLPKGLLEHRHVWWGVGGGAVLAALWRHPVLSPWFVILGGAVGWMLVSTAPSVERGDLQELENFVNTLRSVFMVGQSVFASLETIAGDFKKGPLREAIEETVRRYRTEADVKKALASLREVGWPQLDRLAEVLERAGQADERAAQEALQHLEEQVRQSRRLRDRAETVLTLTKGTLRVLQAANLAAIGAATFIPMWHTFYAERPLALVAATAMTFGGSWYFASELKRIGGLL